MQEQILQKIINKVQSMTDPVEQTPEYLKIKDELEAEIEESLKHCPHGLGFCHLYWSTKKTILKEKYNIDWKSPAELNPNIIYD